MTRREAPETGNPSGPAATFPVPSKPLREEALIPPYRRSSPSILPFSSPWVTAARTASTHPFYLCPFQTDIRKGHFCQYKFHKWQGAVQRLQRCQRCQQRTRNPWSLPPNISSNLAQSRRARGMGRSCRPCLTIFCTVGRRWKVRLFIIPKIEGSRKGQVAKRGGHFL